jgi:hypothetical protein
VESRVFSKALDDGSGLGKGRGSIGIPGAQGHGKGLGMLHWKPEERIGSHVPFGKLAQEGRHPKGTTSTR